MRQPRTWRPPNLWPGLLGIALATLVDLTLDLSRWAFVLVLFTGWALSELILRLLRPTARESVE